MATKEACEDKLLVDPYAGIPPEHDGRRWRTPPPGWKPEASPLLAPIEIVSQDDYDSVVRKLIVTGGVGWEKLWRAKAIKEGFRNLVVEKKKSVQALVTSVLQLDPGGPWPTLDNCIPVGSILDVTDRYFWEYTDIPRELPFFYVLHYVMAKLMQQGVEIHKGKQSILPDLWTVVLAPSGAGKTLSQKALAQAMGGEIKTFPDSKTSLKFLTNLRDHRLSLFLRDEFAQFLKSVSKDTGMQDVRDYLLRTYDNGNIEHASTKSSVVVHRSAIGILGYTPVATFSKYLTAEMLLDGFAQRFSFCVAERDDRPIVGDYDFDGLSPLIKPLWDKITKTPFHPVYKVSAEGRDVFNQIVGTIVARARQDGIDDSFSRRLAFTTYKYGLAYHVLSGNTDDTINAGDLAFGAQLTAMHLLHLRKVMDLYALPKTSASTMTRTPASLPVAIGKKVKGMPLTYEEKMVKPKGKVLTFAAAGKKTDTRLLGGYVKDSKALLTQILTELASDPELAPHIELPT